MTHTSYETPQLTEIGEFSEFTLYAGPCDGKDYWDGQPWIWCW